MINETQTYQVLVHLKKKKSITSWEAIHRYNATRLADIVFRLRKYGHNIVTVLEKKDGKTWAKYVYMGANAK